MSSMELPIMVLDPLSFALFTKLKEQKSGISCFLAILAAICIILRSINVCRKITSGFPLTPASICSVNISAASSSEMFPKGFKSPVRGPTDKAILESLPSRAPCAISMAEDTICSTVYPESAMLGPFALNVFARIILEPAS